MPYDTAGSPQSLRSHFRPRTLLGLARRRLPLIIVAVIAIMGLSSITGFFVSAADQARLRDYIYTSRDVRAIQQALVDAETGVRGTLLTGKLENLEPYMAGIGVLEQQSPHLIAAIDAFSAASPLAAGDPNPVSHRIATLRQVWASASALALDQNRSDAANLLQANHAKALMDDVREFIRLYLAYRNAQATAAWDRIETEQDLLLVITLVGALSTIGATSYAFYRSAREAEAREAAILTSTRGRKQTEQLFGMADMLQSAASREDSNAILTATAMQLMPGFGGALYVFNNSRDRLDLSVTWGGVDTATLADHIVPDSCWALKRGKPHTNGGGENDLRCRHANPQTISLEIPMAARGETLGLLALYCHEPDAAAALHAVHPVALALADAMSLALANIALRERLRNQALRDPLTGLYNRRFLEEMLERMTQDAERRKAPIAAIMLDLDHFKRLNDQFGHATGDLVLREVASSVIASLRATDVACRYGGEEIAILLPDCSLDMAAGKAEQIRVRFASIAASGAMPSVTGSFGVASMPETCGRAADLLPIADAALYKAKQQGRDRVVVAPSRPSADTIWLPAQGTETLVAD